MTLPIATKQNLMAFGCIESGLWNPAMPNKPKTYKPLGTPTKQQQRKAYDRRRGTASERGYDSKWAEYSEWFKRQPENALCAMCGQRPSKITDHIIAVTGPDDPLFWDMRDHQGLCRPCNNKKTIRFDGGYGKPRDESKEGEKELKRMLDMAGERARKIEERMGAVDNRTV